MHEKCSYFDLKILSKSCFFKRGLRTLKNSLLRTIEKSLLKLLMKYSLTSENTFFGRIVDRLALSNLISHKSI